MPIGQQISTTGVQYPAMSSCYRMAQSVGVQRNKAQQPFRAQRLSILPPRMPRRRQYGYVPSSQNSDNSLTDQQLFSLTINPLSPSPKTRLSTRALAEWVCCG